MSGRDEEEQQLRIDQMTINIEKMRSDMAAQQKQLAWETRKFLVSFVLAAAAAVGAGVALGNYIGSRPQQPQTIIIQQQPLPPAAQAR